MMKPRSWSPAACILVLLLTPGARAAASQNCRIHATQFDGWGAQQVSNEWVTLTLVPQLGGRLMQVEFDGHPYLFVNPRFAGKYISPALADGKWINYGGDKIWPMPEGNRDEQHWVLESSVLDDAPYAFRIVDQGQTCTVEMDGPADDKTGLQYSRQISISSDSPAIHFHAVMHNATAHDLQWSVQSVSQYNLAGQKDPNQPNRNFWAYTSLRSPSAYLDGYRVQSGLADDPAFQPNGGLFRLHWMYSENEVWTDSASGWLAIADGESGYGMVERFHFDPSASYPGKATVIFYQNGPGVEFDKSGNPQLSIAAHPDIPAYMEAEVNSPLITLVPGASYAFDTTWFPLRIDPDITQVTEAGVTMTPLQATGDPQKFTLSGKFSAVVPGQLQLRLYDESGRDKQHIDLGPVSPRSEITLNRALASDFPVSRVSLHVIDRNGADWGAVGEITIKER